MLSLPDEWSYSLKGLATISVEGIDAIRQTIAELEKHRYVIRSRIRDEKGCLRGSEYVIYEQPPAQDTDGAQDQPDLGDPAQDTPMLESPVLESRVQGSPTLEGTTLSNTKEEKTYPIKEKAAANPYQSCQPTESACARISMGWDEKGCAAAALHREGIHERIAYDLLLQDSAIDKGRLDEIVDIMAETLCATNDTMRIAGIEVPTAQVQERFHKINNLHIQYVFQCLRQNTSKVRNIKKYMLAVLYNAPSTMDGYYAAMVNHNFGGLSPDDF
jgi:hypothetical protein